MTDTRIITAPDVRPVFQVATGDADSPVGTAVYDTAVYDDVEAVYAGMDADWSDEGCDVVEAVCWLGRQRSADVFDVGTATVRVRNDDGRWDYPPPSPPPTPLTLRPGRQCRVGVEVGGVTSWLWHGWIDIMTPTYTPIHDLDTVTVSAVCAKGEFGRVAAPAVDTPAGAGETVTARLDRYADLAGFPEHRRLFDPSGVTLIANSLGGRLGELGDTAATSAGGDLFGDQAGRLRFIGADWRTRPGGDPVDGVIGNRGIAAIPATVLLTEDAGALLLEDGAGDVLLEAEEEGAEVCPSGWEIEFARSDYSTRVNYGRSGEPAATIDDPVNQGRYGIETWDVTNLETEDDGLLAQLGARALTLRSFDRAPRVSAVTVNAARPGAAQLLAGADPFRPSTYVCGLVQDERTVFARTMYLTGVEHTITAGAWTARLALDDATPWLTDVVSRYDDAYYDSDLYTADPI